MVHLTPNIEPTLATQLLAEMQTLSETPEFRGKIHATSVTSLRLEDNRIFAGIGADSGCGKPEHMFRYQCYTSGSCRLEYLSTSAVI